MSGSSVLPLVLRATAPGVVVDGADNFSDPAKWTLLSGDVWKASTVTWAPKQVFADGQRLTVSTASPASLPARTFRYVAGTGLYVNAGGGNPGTHACAVGRRNNALVMNGRSWITVEGMTFTRTEDRTVQLASQSDDVTFVGNTVTFSNKYGIYVSDCERVRIASSVFNDHNHHGIMLTANSTQCMIEDNEAARNALPGTRAANGVHLYSSPRNTLRNNRWHHNQDTGEHFQTGANENVSIHNLSWANGDHGFDHLRSSGTIHLGDVAYGNFKDGFSIEGTAPQTRLSNCIAVDNGLTTSEFNLWVDASSASGLVSNDNVFWNSNGQPSVKYISTIHPSVAAFSAATGHDTRTLESDPRFVDPAAANFHLQPTSPAIDNADSREPDWPLTDAEGHPRVDDLAVPNAGLGSISFADRGALEYQPAGLPPVAALAATPAAGTAPVSVSLSAAASTDPEGAIVSYLFDFGDGTTAGPQASPLASHTYAAGNWTATVTVVDAQGLSAVAAATVFSNRAPLAVLNMTPATGRAPLNVTAIAAGSTDLDGSIVAYTFDFGDGTVIGPQAGSSAVHNYGTGTWLASVTVRDDRGATTALATPVTVTVLGPNQPPVAALTLTPNLGPAPLVVNVDASGSHDNDGTIVSYAFDFGDGTQLAAQPNAVTSHTFASGSSTVTVTVTDSDGGTATATAGVTATSSNQPPNGIITAPAANTTVSAGQSVLFTSTASDPDNQLPIRYEWSFGGGAPASTLQNPGPVVFSLAGTYTVSLLVRDGLDLADPSPDTRVVTVLPADTSVAADEIHWTITGQNSVTFDWRGPVNTIRYGLTTEYDQTVTAVTPSPLPWSSPGPFWEARLTGLLENTVYHYAIGNGPDHTFRTPPPRGSSGFTIMAEGDIGAAADYPPVAGVQAQIAAQTPAFVLALGDLTYGNESGIAMVDHHFNDMMVWSQDAAYMPVWGNHEWESVTDDLRNYKGRFDFPNPRVTPDIPPPNDGGEDWYWFDYGNVRFIAYPEPFSNALDDWFPRARAIMDSAQTDPVITHIVTFGHRPAYSSGHHAGETRLQGYLDELGLTHSKYVLNLNGHSHNYERSTPQSGVVHLTVGTGGSPLETDTVGDCDWAGGCPPPSWSAFRTFHRGPLRLRFTSGGIEGALLCGPAGATTGAGADDLTCTLDTIIDSFVIGTPTPDQAPVVTAPAIVVGREDSVLTVPVTASDADGDAVLFLSADLSRLPQGSDAVFTPAPDFASGVLTWHPTPADSGTYTVTFSASNSLAGAASTTIRVLDHDRAPSLTPSVAAVTMAEDSLLTLTLTATDPDGQALTALSAIVLPAPPGSSPSFAPGPGLASGTFQWRPAHTDSGAYIVRFQGANTLATTLDVPVTVANVDRAPVVGAPASAAVTESGLLTFGFTIADPDSDAIVSLNADLSELPLVNDAVFTPGLDNRTAQFSWSPSFADSGFYHVTFTATNALTGTARTSIVVFSNDRAPIVTRPAEVAGAEAALLSVGITAVDPDSQVVLTLTADLSGLPPGHTAVFTPGPGNRTGLLEWVPGYADAGDWTVRWIASNALAETTSTVLHIANTDRAPSVSAPVSVDRPAGAPLGIGVLAADIDGDAITQLTADLSVLPPGHNAVFTPAPDRRSGTLTWTPAVGDTGSFTIVFTATNAMSGSASTVLQITRPNLAPLASFSITPRTGNAPLGTTLDATGSVDPDGTILSYRFDFGDGTSAGPQGSPLTTHLYGTGQWTALVTVTDAFGAVSTVALPVTVAAALPSANLVGNPSFESNALGWSAYSSSTYTRVAGGFDGNSSVQVTSPGTMSSFGINDSPNWVGNAGPAGTRYRFSAWVRSVSSLGSAKLQIREYLGNTKIGSTLLSAPVPLSPVWQLVTVDHITQAAGTTLDFQVYDQPVVTGEVFLVDNVSICVVPNSVATGAIAAMDSSRTRGRRETPMLDTADDTLPPSGGSLESLAPLMFRAAVVPTVVRADATLSFATTVPGPVRAELFDASGRRVRVLLDGAHFDAGVHQVPVNGRADDGYLFLPVAGGRTHGHRTLRDRALICTGRWGPC
ncbi:MAG: PKD domain-containing protein [Candidatus Eisenbacteria bacterium]